MSEPTDWLIRRYTPSDASVWNDFVASARNATFLFNRGYMDYHADRFADNSLIAFRRDKIAALLPANITPDGVLHSHQGLTYGGWILPRRHFDCGDMLTLFDVLIGYCRAEGICAVDYKPLPSIYASAPSDEALYVLWRYGAQCTEANISATVDITDNPGMNSVQRNQFNRCVRMGAQVVELCSDDDLALFYALLRSCLAERHDAAPVHTLDELLLLRRSFPANIRFFATKLYDKMHAVICVYDTGMVRHCQYIATTPEGRKNNLLTPLTAYLMHTMLPGQRYFDFGTSNEDGGHILNTGLYAYKASYGATGIIHSRFRLEIK